MARRARARVWKTASAAASCSRELTPSASSSAQATRRRVSRRCARDLDRVGEIIFALGVGIADARQQPSEIGDAEGHDARIAQPDAALALAGVFVLADGGDARRRRR